jgi:hypothetical protein
MKKIIFLIMLSIFISKLSFAQVGITAGIGASMLDYKMDPTIFSDNYTYSADQQVSVSVRSFNLGAFYEIKLNNILYLQPGISYIRKGGKVTFTEYDANSNYDLYDGTIKSDYINVPVNIRFKFGNKNKFLLDAGFYGAYCLKTSFETGGQTSTWKRGTDYKSCDLGLNLGAGFQFSNFQITGACYYGLTDTDPTSYTTSYNTTFCLNFAYVFGHTSSTPSQRTSSPSKSSSGE